ncbi:NADPH-dependent diflavin oxidoreductase 1 [Coemansia erecta]|uniref:NADPH-dependent diflavin oxidoreductase 1 n=1 Tax=Coemansia erecta TaxID=147472 RepID=A0A9W8CPH8_9FUNG|nr:NADPH-dependent diflavin oxidoreductase 1 [Coemansia erecta]
MADREILILYGSQTGYAEDTARRIGREAWRRHFTCNVQAMDAAPRTAVFKQSSAACPVAIFVCSTTGQGAAPDNMRRFWRMLLRKALGGDALLGLHYAVFGLGDSAYAQYNFAGKRLFRRLAQLGAQPLVARGDGDDQHYLGVDGALDTWLETLWAALDARWPSGRAQRSADELPPPAYPVEIAAPGEAAETPAAVDGPSGGWMDACMAVNERLTAETHFQDVRRMRLELVDDTQAADGWEPGDWAVVRPQNAAAEVDRFLAATRWAGDLVVHAKDGVDIGVPPTTTVRWLATYVLDISGVPRRSFFEYLARFATHEDERGRLSEFASAAGQDELQAYCMRVRRTLCEVLEDFPHSQGCVPLARMLDVFPRLATRAFSISSDADDSAIELTVAVVHYRTRMQRARTGVCTAWLAGLAHGAPVRVRVEQGTIRLPADASRPVVMVGPGTGVAAFMAFARRRRCQWVERGVEHMGATHLFFGARAQHGDFLYKDQLAAWAAEGWLTVHCAFSRDQAPDTAGIAEGIDVRAPAYVQDCIAACAQDIWRLLEDGAFVYVSGNARRMPDDVRAAFAGVVDTCADGRMAGDAYVREMVRAGRYQEECWY